MIEYVEIYDAQTRALTGIIDSFKSVIWHSVYYGCGDFEVYAPATVQTLLLLKQDNYVGIPGKKEPGVIERIEITNNIIDGFVITAKGRFVKSILDRRHICNYSGHTNTPTILTGNVQTAVKNLVKDNAILCAWEAKRQISFLKLGTETALPDIIVDANGNAAQKQVSFQNLLSYSDSVLEEYKMSGKVVKPYGDTDFYYEVYRGNDHSKDNASGNEPIIFGTDFDNLIESNYFKDSAIFKNVALIGGEGEGLARFFSMVAGSESGLNRRETFIDAASISKQKENQQTYTDSEYRSMLNAYGRQILATLILETGFEGKLNVSGGVWSLNEDYLLGDIVTVQDNKLDLFTNVRITETLETQNENGYSVEVTYLKEA